MRSFTSTEIIEKLEKVKEEVLGLENIGTLDMAKTYIATLTRNLASANSRAAANYRAGERNAYKSMNAHD